jgi:hypothetical protein
MNIPRYWYRATGQVPPLSAALGDAGARAVAARLKGLEDSLGAVYSWGGEAASLAVCATEVWRFMWK